MAQNLTVFMLLTLVTSSFGHPQRLVKHLFSDYTFEASPQPPVSINATIMLKDLIEVNEKDETIKISEWRCYYWLDERLTWDPKEFGNLTVISVPHTNVWKPDIRLYDVVERQEIVQDLDVVKVRVMSDGLITFCQPELSTVRCLMDVSLLPFDIQNCSLQYESWSQSTNQLRLHLLNDWFMLDQHFSSNEWRVLHRSVSVGRSSYPEGNRTIHYDHILFRVSMTRIPNYYMWVIVVPGLILTTLNMLGAFSPFNAGGERQEKVTLGLTTLLAMTVLLQIVADAMPRSSHGLPLLGKYILFEISITATVTAVSVAIMFVNHRALSHDWDPPGWLLKCLRVKIEKPARKEEEETGLIDAVKVRKQGGLNFTIVQLQQSIHVLSDVLRENRDAKLRQKVWNRALDRVDVCLMWVLIIVNFNVSVAVFWPIVHHLES